VESENEGVVENKREKKHISKQGESSKEGGSKAKARTQEEVPYPRIRILGRRRSRQRITTSRSS
jgi:hypothetical protein